MASYSKADLIEILRNEVGDNSTDTEGLFLSDIEWEDGPIDTALARLAMYCKKEAETSVDGTGVKQYVIPSAAVNTDWDSVFIRRGTTHADDTEIEDYDTFAGNIYMPVVVNTGEKVIFWIKRAYDITVDDISDSVLDIIKKIAQIQYIEAAMFRRADYVKWTALNKSAASVNQLVVIKDELQKDLAKIAEKSGDGAIVSNLSRYK